MRGVARAIGVESNVAAGVRVDMATNIRAIGVYKTVDPNGDRVRAARAVGITFGDCR